MIERYRQLFERLVAELPVGTARVNEYRVPKDDGTVIKILPANHACASFGVHLNDGIDLVDFSFGRIGTWELPLEGRNRRASAEDLLAEVEQMRESVTSNAVCFH